MWWLVRSPPISQAREWFNKTVKIDPDLGDAWALFYKLELVFGSSAQQQDVMERCSKADPRHGEHWQATAKHVSNWRKKTSEILQIVADKLPIPVPNSHVL